MQLVLKRISLRRRSGKPVSGLSSRESLIHHCVQELIRHSARVALKEQALTDVLDIWIPATGAGLANVNEGVLGVFGSVPTREILTCNILMSFQFRYICSGTSKAMESGWRAQVVIKLIQSSLET